MKIQFIIHRDSLTRALVIVLASAIQVGAGITDGEAKIENDSPVQLLSLKGKLVVLEGVIWGKGWPGLGARIVLVSGQRIYFDGKHSGDKVLAGKLTRVRGKLMLRQMRASKLGEPGYGKSFEYWIIEEPTFEAIERIQSENILEYKSVRRSVKPDGQSPDSKTNGPLPAKVAK